MAGRIEEAPQRGRVEHGPRRPSECGPLRRPHAGRRPIGLPASAQPLQGQVQARPINRAGAGGRTPDAERRHLCRRRHGLRPGTGHFTLFEQTGRLPPDAVGPAQIRHGRGQALPGAGRGALLLRLDTAGEEELPGASQGHVEQVEFLPGGVGRLGLEQSLAPGAALRPAPDQGEMARPRLLRRPVEQDGIGLAMAARVVGIQQPDHGRFQPLGGVDGEDAHPVLDLPGANRTLVGRFLVRRLAQPRQFVEEARQAGVAAGIEGERQGDEGLQVGRHARPHGRRHGRPVARHEVPLVVDAVEQIMHGQLCGPGPPARQQGGGTRQRRRGRACRGASLQALPPVRLGAAGQRQEIAVAGAEERRAQGMGEGQAVRRGGEAAQQRGEIRRLQGAQQPAPADAEVGNARGAQRPLELRQHAAPARQHHDVAIARRPLRTRLPVHDGPAPDDLADLPGKKPRLGPPPPVFLGDGRLGEWVAQPGRGSATPRPFPITA